MTGRLSSIGDPPRVSRNGRGLATELAVVWPLWRDNESGKGDYGHVGDRDEPYGFLSVEQLLADFRNDCAPPAGWRWE